jgi:mercuric ion transport protein
MIAQEKSFDSQSAERPRDAAKMLFAAGGLVAAFGVASCCALPVALSLLGVSAASLLGIGMLAALYQQELFVGAVILLGGAALIMWRQRRAVACQPGSACARPMVDWASKLALALAVGLLALTFWIEPPI